MQLAEANATMADAQGTSEYDEEKCVEFISIGNSILKKFQLPWVKTPKLARKLMRAELFSLIRRDRAEEALYSAQKSLEESQDDESRIILFSILCSVQFKQQDFSAVLKTCVNLFSKIGITIPDDSNMSNVIQKDLTALKKDLLDLKIESLGENKCESAAESAIQEVIFDSIYAAQLNNKFLLARFLMLQVRVRNSEFKLN